METQEKRLEKLSQSITVKALVVGFLIILLLIPSVMMQELISERKFRSQETIEKINNKWSQAQTLCAPVLSIPYTISYANTDGKLVNEQHLLHLTPEHLTIDVKLFPEEKYYGIYKTILYRSEVRLKGGFEIPDIEEAGCTYHWDKAFVHIGISDLRGVTSHIDFNLKGHTYAATAGSRRAWFAGNELVVNLNDDLKLEAKEAIDFDCTIDLNGSSSIHFIPIGKTTQVHIAGAWNAPGFIGNFSPEHTITETGFDATWKILHFNRSIPDSWIDNGVQPFTESSFGVSLVDTVDHYQQNMRSAKYAILFIALTFVIFFFVEILTKKRIHPIQYLLVGLALILFYALLLSISEQLSFAIAYVIASVATIGMIALYAQSIFKNRKQTGILIATLCLLYVFLYVILQLEEVALLIGSIGLFLVLAVIMYCSRKVNWYKEEAK
ncbi:inner membrane protein [Parabacteroides sp. PFB2-10]|uniref:cell envelope integrity protein CreD n=1 Tax=Parabacteroides sp. PFB2-10 TaxID=1742405 RepID=UPI002473DA9D|nr:cell envelope integrity protein CreD [Parabacteroides sp. PFB2-10]MDH6311648.1 inner membrane protein [Parabacteroides sp. PFB2-10]MDL2245635.1 cell envelope integrity protein CreD [Parabacteroides sp. OttesenSCG-928-J18]